jgi:hypothetical protein
VTVVVLVAVALSVWFGLRSTTVTTTSTTAAPTTSVTPVAAVWPTTASGVRYVTAAAAASGFASDFLHMTSPIVGSFRVGSSDTGRVGIRFSSSGPTTWAEMLRSRNGEWWVTGATTADIVIASPAPLALAVSPLRVRGESTAFEAVVNVSLREDTGAALLATTVMGGANGVMGPFATTLSFATPATAYGDLVLYDRSAKNGSVLCAAVVRLRF